MSRFLHQPKVGLALSVGGARGFAHIGVLKVLERESISIDFLAGASIGGVIAAGYAAGLGTEYMEGEALRLRQLRNLLMLVLPPTLSGMGLVSGKHVQDYFARHLEKKSFGDLAIPLALVAADLETGEEVVLQSGSAAEAVRATISMPGVLPPFEVDGRLLIDGGVTNPLPADIVRRMGADVVIAVDVSPGFENLPSLSETMSRGLPLTQIPLIIEILNRAVGIMESQICAYKLREAKSEVLIQPAVAGDITALGGFSRAEECIAAGEEAADLAMSSLREYLEPAGRTVSW